MERRDDLGDGWMEVSEPVKALQFAYLKESVTTEIFLRKILKWNK